MVSMSHLAGAVVLGLAASAALAEDTPAAPPVAAPWQSACYEDGDARHCEATQAVILSGGTTPLAQVALGWLKPDGAMMLTVVVPPDVSLSGPLMVGTLTLPWSRCRPGGCFAVAEIDKDQLDALRAGESGGSVQLGYTDGTEAAMTLRLKLDGFGAAVDRLEAARAE